MPTWYEYEREADEIDELVDLERKREKRKQLTKIPRNNKGQFVKGVKMPKEWVKANSEGHKGISHHISSQTKKKISKKAKIIFNTPEYKKKISAVRKKVFNTPEMKQKYSERAKQFWKQGIFKPIKHNRATKIKLAEAQRGRVHLLKQNRQQAYKLFLRGLEKRLKAQRREAIRQFWVKWQDKEAYYRLGLQDGINKKRRGL